MSAPHAEIELKLVLADDLSYGLLRSWLDAHATAFEAVQDNRYLDTADRALARRRMMLRVRLTPAKVVCTAKAGAHMVDGLMQVSEWQRPMDDALAQTWRRGRSSCELSELPIARSLVDGPLRDLSGAMSRTFHVLGAMQTTRRAYEVACEDLGLPPGPKVILELDHTLFPAGAERYELEIEHPDAAQIRSAATALLDSLGVQWHPAERSKYQQFLEVLASGESIAVDDQPDGF
ncbi:MAG: CYTH domain-containing protein [Myxococcales bacterium]|nr:CYTH domain-containing protein [Myxococcales bacterium]